MTIPKLANAKIVHTSAEFRQHAFENNFADDASPANWDPGVYRTLNFYYTAYLWFALDYRRQREEYLDNKDTISKEIQEKTDAWLLKYADGVEKAKTFFSEFEQEAFEEVNSPH